MPPKAKNYAKPQWPAHAANTIHTVATILEQHSALHYLLVIENEIYGNIPRIVTLGGYWAAGKSSGDSKAKEMSELATEITGAASGLASYWEGSAYDAYQNYATATATALTTDGGNGGVMGEFSAGLGECARIIFDTYSLMLTAIGNCAADLIGLNATNVLYAIADAIPGVDVAAIPATIAKVVSTLEDFVKQCTNVIAGAVKEFGDSTKTALAFQTSASAFVAPPAVPSSFGQAGSWQVRPQPNNTGQPYNPTNGRG
jgi:hypothetical protein